MEEEINMVKQSRIERRKSLRRLWDEMGKKFIVIYFIGIIIVIALPFTRYNPLFYLLCFLITFSISFFLLFFRVREKPPDLTYGDR